MRQSIGGIHLCMARGRLWITVEDGRLWDRCDIMDTKRTHVGEDVWEIPTVQAIRSSVEGGSSSSSSSSSVSKVILHKLA
ncbi:hypothetical protein V6N11_082697 [Hibiscus sabdariffa]|uniref:DUF2917 domain-containing protein n=1 Tax=Hibiscus sabdariffa TaxID=183260 RepID=A0ABR2A8L1_9ROSI